ncbi:LuxR C-terminal-related transcriptional regulator [Yersinia enterocolitica]
MITVNVPFNSSRFDCQTLINKINKIIDISCYNYSDVVNGNVHKWLRLDNNVQLTFSESRIVELTEQGNNVTDISKKLCRSKKTILSHRRRVIIKLGGLNRLDFYNYISKMKNYSNKKTVFICL